MTESDLWNRVLLGDMTALSLLYSENYNLLFNWGMKFVSNDEMVKDCIQDVFVKICTSRRLSPTANVRSYLLTSMRNVIFDRLGSSYAARQSLDDHMFEIEESDVELERLFLDDDESLNVSRRLIAAYNALTPNQRMGVYLRYVRGMSHKEVAAVMGVNPQSVMNLLSRAMKSLRETMGNKPVLAYLYIILASVE